MKDVYIHGRLGAVPNQPRTPHRTIRVDDELWTGLGDAASTAGADRSALIKQFIAWYLRRPGVKLPERPPARRDGH